MVADVEIGMLVWASSVGRYRRIISIDGPIDDGRLKVHARDERSGEVVAMAISLPEAVSPKRLLEPKAKRERFKPKTPEQRAALADGFLCRARGHDLTKPLEDGKPATTPSGSCRQCYRERKAAS